MPKKIVLAYSGGLDTSVILKWLQNKYECPVVTFTADIGQGEELSPVETKAKSLGVEEIFIENLQEEFVKDYVFPMFRANALYEGTYLLGTAIARPLIAKRQIEIAKIVGADAVAHGATGKGNDQVRFELGYYANNPKIEVIAPWRDWEFDSRNDLLDYAEKNQITVPKDKMGEPPFSTDANLLHTSSEGKLLEDPWLEPPEHIFSRTKSIEDTPNKAEIITIGFENGDPVSINEEKLKPHEILTKLNSIIEQYGAKMAGWDDIILQLSEKNQSETKIKKEMLKLNPRVYVWNNTWGGGREDMIYKITNAGFEAVMSNSSAFYFDMAKDYDFESLGLSWSGYIDYKDTWGTEPFNVFSNMQTLRKNDYLDESKIQNDFNFLSDKSKINSKLIDDINRDVRVSSSKLDDKSIGLSGFLIKFNIDDLETKISFSSAFL